MDLEPFKHGEEGTHSVCNKHFAEFGGEARCCECSKKTDCGNNQPSSAILDLIDKAVGDAIKKL